LQRIKYEQQCGEILSYIDSKPNKTAVRYIMVDKLSSGDKNKKSNYSQVCKAMIKEGVLCEDKTSSNKVIVKKKRKPRKNTFETMSKEQCPSVYYPKFYALTSAQQEYKVLYTVAEPQCLDSINNTCEFISESRGVKYYTSLEKCSCPAFHSSNVSPCKHMIALANKLGYYHYQWI
jgi:hypothetical protein